MIIRNTQTEAEVKREKLNRIMDGVDAWASFYRHNPHRFAEDYLGLKLDKFQQIILCAMFFFANLIFLASRGAGKSFLMAVFCVCYSILYPGSRICIASKTRKQAAEPINKIQEILMPLSENLRSEIKEIKTAQNESFVSFWNGSIVVVVTATESSRHNRATVLIVDEFRLVDKNTIDTVLRKFLTSQRHPAFLDDPKYKDYPKERTKELYASSCWYEAHWSYELVRSYVVNMIRGRSYFCCSIPYQLSIKEGRLDREKIEDEMSETTFNAVSFRMEMEALYFGKGDGGLYKFEEIDKNRKLVYPLYPKTFSPRLGDKRIAYHQKVPGEIRILSADIALMSSSKNRNDATSIFLNQMIPNSSGQYTCNISYVENNEGLRTDAQALVIRRLFDDLDCDYIALDTRGLGLGVSDALMSDMLDADRGVTHPALSCCNNEELAKRCMVKDAPKVIWSIQGTAEFNSQCALGLREALRSGYVRLLLSEYDADEILEELKGYGNLTPQEMVEYKLPYVYTSLLVNELINLEYEVKNNAVRVKEKSGMRKDMYSSLGYNIYVAKAIERENTLENSRRDLEGLIFKFRAPKLKQRFRGGV